MGKLGLCCICLWAWLGRADEIVLHSFEPIPLSGASPRGGLMLDPAGNLYGTASGGGTGNAGVVFRVDTAGNESVLYSFTGGADGGQPYAGVIADAAGNLYGTTYSGGASNAGVVYKLDTTGQESVLYSFSGGADGGHPYAGVIVGRGGHLYGTAVAGGAANQGVVYEVDGAGKETVLHSFTGGVDGGQPYGGVIGDAAGNLYGTTYGGGAPGWGVVYKLDAAGHESLLHTFAGGGDGLNPYAGLIRDAAGNLYGTTYNGGTGCPGTGCGTVYEVDATGKETVLLSFADHGINPYAGVIRDAAGNLYGTTLYEGVTGGTCRPYGCGVVYELDTAGHETALHNFSVAPDGGNPYAGVVRDAAGNLYGATANGGTIGLGIVYKLDAAGQETVLYNFPGGTDGAYPFTGVTRDSAGNLYGTTDAGGIHGYGAGDGTVYKVDAAGTETVLYSFGGLAYPSGVIRDAAGELFGTAAGGGIENCGSSGCVYQLSEGGKAKVLYSFTGGADGEGPTGGVIRDAAGNLFGTAEYGGIFNFGCSGGSCGVVYRLDTNGQQTVLYSFTGGADGAAPSGGVIRDANGNLYGTTDLGGTENGNCVDGCGVVFKLDTAGRETVLHSFKGGADGSAPEGAVIRDAAGNLYGTTFLGGIQNDNCIYGCGVVFKVDAAGHETVLYSFTGGADGSAPLGGVVMDAAGNLYGTTRDGGTLGNCYAGPSTGCGVVFKVDTAGKETVLYSFTGGADGGNSFAGLVLDAAGNLYGTTWGGGAGNMGVVFEITGAAN